MRREELIFAANLAAGHDPTDAGIDAHDILRGVADLARLERRRGASPIDRARIAAERAKKLRALMALAKPYGTFDGYAIETPDGRKIDVPLS